MPAMPGMLPVINQYCVEQAVRTGLGLKAQINLSIRVRPEELFLSRSAGRLSDLAVQASDRGRGRGHSSICRAARRVRVGIERLHLEQDAGKSLHDQHPDHSYVDLNRAGVALMEIVTSPDMRSSEEAAAFLRKLRAIVRYLGTCDGNMDEGSMRADVNVSVRKPGAPLGTRCEIKNVNSMRFVAQAVEYEARRQIDILEDGGTIKQETRLFDTSAGETRSMRSKEEAHDYRYFPDPDLLPLVLDQAWVDDIAGVAARTAGREEGALHQGLRAFGLRCVRSRRRAAKSPTISRRLRGGADAKAAANWLNNEYFGRLNTTDCRISQTRR